MSSLSERPHDIFLSLTGQRFSRRRALALAATGAFALLPAACGSSQGAGASGPAAAPTLRLAFQPPYIAVFVLQQQKLLEKVLGSSTSIQYRRLLSLDPISEAIAGGSVDLGMGGTPIGAIASNQPIRILALVEHSPKTHAILVRPNSSIKSIADLKGKKIGTPTGRNNVFVLRALQEASIKDSEVQWLKLENNEGQSALVTGAIDAWQTWDPFYANAQLSKEAIALVDGERYIQNYVAIFGRADYIEKYPDTLKQFLKAYKQALDYVKAHHSEAVNLFVQQNKLSSSVAELTFNRREYLLHALTSDYIADVADQSKRLHQAGVIQNEPDWSRVVDTTIASQVLSS